MNFVDVKSSNVRAVAWENNCLYVAFINSNATYRYDGVPEERYGALLRSESKGRFLHMWIKGNYPYCRIS